MSVRLATEADIPRLVAMGRALFRRAGWPPDITCDDVSMETTLRALMANPDAAVLVHDHGFAGLILSPAYFNHALRFAKKLWWYAKPGHPEARTALFGGMEDWARTHGAVLFFANATDGMGPAAVGRFYERAGYRFAEHVYMKRL